ncbi:MAG: CHAT domain-containing protein [Acidobacteria bacterium]|nr:CHAT domain-containing protein [Acidobacteriota bacterium]
MTKATNNCYLCRRIAPRGVGCLVSLLLIACSSSAAQSNQEVRVLEPDQPIERALAGVESHFYRLTLAAGQSMQVTVEQPSINARLRLFGPDDKLLVESSSWWEGLRRLWWVAETNGAYRLEILSANPHNATRLYRVSLEELRPAGPPERLRVAAQQAFYEARELQSIDEVQSRFNAIPKFQQALQLWRAFGDQRQEARVLLEITINYAELSEYQQALDYGQQALRLRQTAADRRWEATLLNTVGEAYQYLGEYEQARASFEQALPLWRALGHRPGEAWTLNDLGSAYHAVGARQQAFDYYQQALSVYQAAGEADGQALELTRLGAFYAALGEPEKAREALLQALQFWQVQFSRGYPDSRQARTLHYLGDVSAASAEHAAALEYYNQALQRWRTIGDRYWESITLHSMGQTAAAASDAERAFDCFNQALALRRDIGDRRGQAATLTQLGALHYAAGAGAAALDHFHEALTLRRAIGDREGTADTLYHLARVARERDALDEARAQIEAALSAVEQVRANFISQELRAAYFATVRAYYEFYLDLLMQLHERRPAEGFAAQALQASEQARARSLLELLAEAGAEIRQDADPQLVARARAVEQRLNAAAQRLNLPGNKLTPAQIAALERELTALSDEHQQIEAQLRAASSRYAALTQPQPLKPAEIQQLLDPDTLLLEYALGAERSFLWAVTATTLDSFELPKRTAIEAAAQRVYQLLTARNQRPPGETATQWRARVRQADAAYRVAAAALSQMLLGPVAAQWGNNRLLIVAQGSLQFIPFAALPAPEMERQRDGETGRQKAARRTATPLIVNHEVVNLPSASVLAVLRRETATRPPASRTLAVLADPVFSADDERVHADVRAPTEKPASPGRDRLRDVERAWEDVSGGGGGPTRLARLSGTGWEAEQILARVPAGQRLKALGFDASRAAATAPALSQYRFVHFATHALIDNVHPELSGIVLSLVDEQGRAQDGFLRAHEIFNLKFNAELVVLSACRTGLGKEIKGEGSIGLTRSFMYAGAPRVVVSLWSVRDKEAAELMVRFYKRLLGPERMSPAAALRAAQVELWRGQQWQSPYYWAAFVLQGEWK